MGFFGPSESKVEKWIANRDVTKLIEVLLSNDAGLKRRATEGLAEIRSPEVMKFCQENAQNPEKSIRWQITQILGLIGTPAAMKMLTTVRPPKKE